MRRRRILMPLAEPSEREVQRACISLCERLGFVAAHVPNSMPLLGDRTTRYRIMSVMKADGLRKGYPDLVIAGPEGQVAFVEVKAAKGQLKPEQRVVAERLRGLGHRWLEVRSVDDLAAAFRAWGWAAVEMSA